MFLLYWVANNTVHGQPPTQYASFHAYKADAWERCNDIGDYDRRFFGDNNSDLASRYGRNEELQISEVMGEKRKSKAET